MTLKKTVHNSLRSMLEEILQIGESHHKKNYLAKVNKWYRGKLQAIDERLKKRPIPPHDHQPVVTDPVEYRRQKSLKKRREEIEKDDSPVKRIKIEKSPLNKTYLPPINKSGSTTLPKGTSPGTFKRDDSESGGFSKKVISLQRVPTQDYYDTPYKANNEIVAQGLEMWKKHREKKVILNRSQGQLNRSIGKWGNHKSFHHERSLMVADRQNIVYNDHSRSYKKSGGTKKDSLSNSLFVNQEKFLETDSEGNSSEDDDMYSANNTKAQVHDLSYLENGEENSAYYSNTKIGNDSFFLTKKEFEGNLSPSKKGAEDPSDIKPGTSMNPLQKLNRIQKFRHLKGALIGANKITDVENIDTIFNTHSSMNRHISLSLYTRPKSLVDRTSYQEEMDTDSFGILSLRKMPNEKNISVQKYQSNHSVQRTRQINEISALNTQLNSMPSQKGAIPVTTIEKAILFPEDNTDIKRKYPKMEDMLLKNPFAKKKKGKKKKGKKKR
uniref:Uncharacterized protein n=1 Tax=Euplotes crassus TaxID=5936 RepID=A0A7S3NZB6_EUPCR|mmetsp:Transcript_35442/g.35103  ORF Transcript_35442/g.35103 Transcript_35442/m.35103 type:complete len:496 (+) Transcript_35442:87-1574(+)